MAQGIVLLLGFVTGLVYLIVQFIFIQDEDYTVTVGPPLSLHLPPFSADVHESTADWDCELAYCSWRDYIPNSLFESTHSTSLPIYEDADQDIFSAYDQRDPPVVCVPESFGYSREQGDRLFPYVGYPTCEEKSRTPHSVIEIDPQTDLLTMHCPNGKGWFYLGIQPQEERLGWDKYLGEVQEYKGKPVKVNGREWALGTCEKDRTTKLEGATYRLRPKAEVLERVKKDMQTKQEEAREKYGETKTRPLTVMFVVMDSLSRKHFYRKLNRTAEFLNGVDPEKFRVFDFKMHNVMGDNSIPNVYPVWTGLPLASLNDAQRNHNKRQETDLTGDSALWSKLKSQGFATMFLAEFCDNYFSSAIGRRPQVDHTAQVFWCAAEKLSGFNDLGKFQRCIGNKNSHWYSLNYTLDFVNAYTGVNKWAHVMSLAGHEDSGTVVETLDADLMDFLKRLMETKDELALFLMADHGMRYGEWFKVIDGSHEHKLPMLFSIVSTSLLRDIPFSMDTMYHNSFRLVSKLDLHTTSLYFGEVPYYRGFTNDNKENSWWLKQSTGGVSLMITKIANNRTCEEIQIPPYFCSCLKFYDVAPDIYQSPSNEEEETSSKIIAYFADQLILQINDDSYTSFHSELGHICRKLTLQRIESVQWQYLSPPRHFYKLVLSVNEHKYARFEGVVLLTAEYMRPRCLEQGYGVVPMYEKGRRQFRVMYMKRLDAYAGLCEDMCRLKVISAPLCICDRLEKIAYREPYLLETLKAGLEIGLGAENESCEEFCEQRGMLCEVKGINALNLCKELEKLTSCSGCYEAESQLSFPGKRGGDCFVSRADMFSCEAKSSSVKRACACVASE